MGAVTALPIRDNVWVKEYLKTMKANHHRNEGKFTDLLNVMSYMENLLEQSGKNMAEMQSRLNELTELQKHPIKTELSNIHAAMKENLESAKSRLAKILEWIVNFCKRTMESFKAAGVSALDKTVSFLKLKSGLEAVSNYAAENNTLCASAVKKIDAFSAEYHKGGRALKNMGRVALGKDPVDTAKENGKLAAAMSAPYRAVQSVWAKIERAAFVLARDLGDFHTRAQMERDNRREAKETAKTDKTQKKQKTDVFKAVEKHKETAGAIGKDKPREVKKKKDER